MSVTERSPAAAARRAQIVAATIAVIADEGFPQASFARIAHHAGLSSTRLISYHFTGKDELIQAVVEYVFGEIGGYMADRVGEATNAWESLCAYIEGNIEFIDTHRPQMKALLEIVLAGGLPRGLVENATAESYLETILRQGQAEGRFRDFDPRVVAMTVQRSIEGLPFLLAGEPDFDTRAYARELVDLFDRGTKQ